MNLELKHLDKVRDRNLQELVQTVVDTHGNITKVMDAEGVIEEILFLLTNDKIINGNMTPMFVDVLVSAAYLHNVVFDKDTDHWTEMLKTREVVEKYVERNRFDSITIDALYQAIEAQLGKHVPNAMLYPAPHSPQAHFALACALHYRNNE